MKLNTFLSNDLFLIMAKSDLAGWVVGSFYHLIQHFVYGTSIERNWAIMRLVTSKASDGEGGIWPSAVGWTLASS